MAGWIKRSLARYWWIGLDAILIGAAVWLAFDATGNWRVATGVGVTLAVGMGVAVLAMRSGGWLMEMASPNRLIRKDDRGAEAVIAPANWTAMELTDVERLRLALWLKENPRRGDRWITPAWILFLLGFVFAVNSIWHLNRASSWLLFACFTLPASLLMRRLRQRRAMARQVPALLAMRRCPACAYGIDDLKAADDGCTVCPECGGAWKLDGAGPMPVVAGVAST